MVGVADDESKGALHRAAEPTTVSEMVFPPGSVVQGTTVLNQTVTGQVLGFDQERKMLIVRDGAGSKPVMRFLNLDMVNENFKITEDRASDHVPFNFSKITEQQLEDRVRKAVQKRESSALQCDVSIEGQRAFIALRKTLDQVKWDMEKIIVFDGKICVDAPYTPDSVKLLEADNQNNRCAVEQVKRILSKPQVPTPLSAVLSLKRDDAESHTDHTPSTGSN
uniref:AD domain-containing protein n=1 Tax=Steinernema glaseri TaxID=37863 RepID=A0A1I7ZGP7_9BILA